jgi:cobalt-zinc-cadmium efflux system protein
METLMFFYMLSPPVSEGVIRPNGSSRPLLLALIVTLTFAVVEVIGGILSGSLALLSDSGHMFTDVLALGLSLGAALLTTRPPTKKHTFGFHRVEILVALINGITLIGLALIIIIEAINRFQHPRQVDSSIMLLISTIGLGANLLGMFILHEKTAENLNVKGAYLHMLGDLLSSIGVIVAALLIMFFGLEAADPVISIVIGAVIIVGAYRLVNQSITILLEAVPEHIDLEEVEKTLLEVEGVKGVNEIHAWTLTSGVYAMSLHIVVGDRTISSCSLLMNEIRGFLKNKFQITHSTIELDTDVCDS